METRPHSTDKRDFELLGIQPGTTLEQAKKAYRKLAKQWHPDRFQNAPGSQRSLAEARFREITDAYHRVIETLEKEPRHHCESEAGPSGPRRNARPKAKAGRRPAEAHSSKIRRKNEKPALSAAEAARVIFTGLSARWARILAGKRLYYAGLALGVLLMGAGLVLLARNNPVIQRTVIPSLEDDRYVLLLPNQTEDPTHGGNKGSKAAPGKESAQAPKTAHPVTARPPFFGLGSTPEEVAAVQGTPGRIVGNAWSYGLSEVRFRQGKVWSYNNFDGNLKVRLVPKRSCPQRGAAFFTLGSTRDEVICAQGTPSRVEGNRWYYGFDEVRFRHGKVVGYNNTYGNLRIRMVPGHRSRAAKGEKVFRLGADRDQVIKTQGTPQSVRNHIWYYSSADIVFVKGRVKWVNDPTHQLNFNRIVGP